MALELVCGADGVCPPSGSPPPAGSSPGPGEGSQASRTFLVTAIGFHCPGPKNYKQIPIASSPPSRHPAAPRDCGMP